MRGINKKILISLLTTLVVFITVFATTYAWVGIFTYANTDSFKMNLKVQDLDSNYFLTISSSGKLGTFSNEVPSIDLQRQIVNNHYNDIYQYESDEFIEREFDKLSLLPTSPSLNHNQLSNFEIIDYNTQLIFVEANEYYKFDIYLSVDTKEGITENTTGIKSNVLLDDIEDTLLGTIHDAVFTRQNPFIDLPSSPINDVLKTIPRMFNVDSKNAARVALTVYDPIEINNEYQGDESPFNTFIYYGGKNNPLYDSSNNSYDLGGILPEEQNTALQELKPIKSTYFYGPSYLLLQEKLSNAISRGNSELSLTDNNKQLWNKREHESYLGCMDGIQTKMKISVYFWFEGWDADCLKWINEQPVTLNLSFTSGTDD